MWIACTRLAAAAALAAGCGEATAPERLVFLAEGDRPSVMAAHAGGREPRPIGTRSPETLHVARRAAKAVVVSRASGGKGEIALLDLASGGEVFLRPGPDVLGPAALSEDGAHLAFFGAEGDSGAAARAWFVARVDGGDLRDARNVYPWTDLNPPPGPALFTPDGRQIVLRVPGAGGEAVVRAAADGSGSAPISPAGRNCRFPALSPDGQTVYYAAGGAQGVPAVILAISLAGAPQRQLALASGTIEDLQISADGGTLVFLVADAASALQVWTVATRGDRARQLTGLDGTRPEAGWTRRYVAASADGSRLGWVESPPGDADPGSRRVVVADAASAQPAAIYAGAARDLFFVR